MIPAGFFTRLEFAINISSPTLQDFRSGGHITVTNPSAIPRSNFVGVVNEHLQVDDAFPLFAGTFGPQLPGPKYHALGCSGWRIPEIIFGARTIGGA
jgi:hypothetical protein